MFSNLNPRNESLNRDKLKNYNKFAPLVNGVNRKQK